MVVVYRAGITVTEQVGPTGRNIYRYQIDSVLQPARGTHICTWIYIDIRSGCDVSQDL